jgi:hypothetical protein
MKKTLDYLNSLPSINQGGCGVAALAIATKHNKSIFSKLFGSFFSNDCHIVVEDDDNYIDSEGIHPREQMTGYVRSENISKQDLIKLVKEAEWDASFDRSNISKIENKLNIKLGL